MFSFCPLKRGSEAGLSAINAPGGGLPARPTDRHDREAGGYSPDQVDALVWLFTDLLLKRMAGEAIFELSHHRRRKRPPKN
jgi:hypothetical protein